ncbi:hypothetical protein B2A_05075, partial [mine drainage metagenome]
IEELGKRGYWVSEEASRTLVRKEKETGEPLPKEAMAFQTLIYEKEIKAFNEAPEGRYCFYDRGLLDSLAYLQANRIKCPQSWIKTMQQLRYDLIFWAPPQREIFKERNITDPRSYQYHLELGLKIKQAYEGFGYIVMQLPKVDKNQDIALGTLLRTDFAFSI